MDRKKIILRVSVALNAVLVILAAYLFISRYILERRVSAYEKIQFNYFNGAV
ncbi:MAG: hypothetical protein MUD12_13245 [Spirochaetes bacterium]|nr:hypothetical protein [Spirochaetota bacterium]